MTKYYEIICEAGVIGVCSVRGKHDDILLHAAREDRVTAFGQLTKAQFDRFHYDGHWEVPISKKRWKPTIKIVLEMKRIK